jgi:FkbH-like protein
MFETDKYEKRLRRTPPHTPDEYEYVRAVDRMSFLYWGEHCVECAAPACYRTCELYQARPDRRCRRFQFGIYRNSAYRSMRGYGVEVAFKKWAKLETRGNTRVFPFRSLVVGERLGRVIAPLMNALGAVLYRMTSDIRWSYVTHALFERLTRRLHAAAAGGPHPDGFLLEVYNPGNAAMRLQLRMAVAYYAVTGRDATPREKRIPGFETTLTINPGYARYHFDRLLFQSTTECGLPFDVALIPEADSEATLVVLTADFVRYAKRENGRANVKCVVWDLDNTLWNGVLLEQDDVEVQPGVRELLRHFDERGILNSVSSKNEFDHAWKRLEELGIGGYFLVPQINWLPKSENIKRIAERLNIGVDTIAFVDDSPFELAEVSAALPMVLCVNASDLQSLYGNACFSGSTNPDAKQRRQYYQDAMRREEVQASFGKDYLSFLASCHIRLEVHVYEPADFERVCELVQRTNQLNFSGRKYSREEVREVIDTDDLEKHILVCADRYGSYGTVGFGVTRVDGAVLRVEDFMLSCRVQGKFIEQAFFAHLLAQCSPSDVQRVWVGYRETDRNKPAKAVLESLGFRPDEAGVGMSLDVSSRLLACDFITVQSSRLT